MFSALKRLLRQTVYNQTFLIVHSELVKNVSNADIKKLGVSTEMHVCFRQPVFGLPGHVRAH